jgi:hypothetical protein
MNKEIISKVKNEISDSLAKNGVVILPPLNVTDSIHLLKLCGLEVTVTMLEPWYN